MTRQMLEAIHQAQIREHGGSPGVRDEGLLESVFKKTDQYSSGRR